MRSAASNSFTDNLTCCYSSITLSLTLLLDRLLKKYFAYAFFLTGLTLTIVSCAPVARLGIDTLTGNSGFVRNSFLGTVMVLAFASLFTMIGVLIYARQFSAPDHQTFEPAPNRTQVTLLNLTPLAVYIGFPMAHLLLPLWIYRRNNIKNPALSREAARLLNFQISWTLFLVVALMLCVVLAGVFILAALILFHLTVTLRAIWKSWHEQSTSYPLNLSFIK